MKTLKRIVACIAVALFVCLPIGCDMAAKVYEPTPEEYFRYENAEGGWLVSAKDINNLPETLNLPESYCDIPVVGVRKDGFKGSSIKALRLPANIKTVGESAFANCTALEDVYFYRGATQIGNAAFYGCTKLSKIELSKDLVSIGDSAFSSCVMFEKINLPEKLENLGSYAFSSCTNLTYVYLPHKLSSIGEGAFDNCDDSLQFELSASNVYYKLVDGKPVKK